MPDHDLPTLRARYTTLYRDALPAAARSRSDSQPHWPVHLDHCFARIILDNAVGVDRPWTAVVKAPATQNMSASQLVAAIELGEGIWSGEKDLGELDRRSLELRGKMGKYGGKRGVADGEGGGGGKRVKVRREGSGGVNEWDEHEGADTEARKQSSEAQLPTPAPSSPHASATESTPADASALNNIPIAGPDMVAARARIAAHPSLTPFRKRTLSLLTQVPRGQYTTYQALADAIAKTSPALTAGKKTSARAVGSAMRNNPFAPEVPCHRVLASDGRLGGFGGVWDEGSEEAGKKRRLLRGEGVGFDGKGRVIGGPFRGFV